MIAVSLRGTTALIAALPKMRADISDHGDLRAGDDVLETCDAFQAVYGRQDRTMLGIETPELFDLGILARQRGTDCVLADVLIAPALLMLATRSTERKTTARAAQCAASDSTVPTPSASSGSSMTTSST